MRQSSLDFLDFLDSRNQAFFRPQDMKIWLGGADDGMIREEFEECCRKKTFRHVCRDVYMNGTDDPAYRNIFFNYQLVHVLRPGTWIWESLESRLSQLGVISQIPNRLTFMTTGESGIEKTSAGVFEFSHSPLTRIPDIRLFEETGIFHATAKQAYEDLKFVGRNLGLVDEEMLAEAIEDEENDEGQEESAFRLQ